ncbi:MAG: 4'-phosphopantetheinyl transferase family protein [Betaproteobacteria bacterium]
MAFAGWETPETFPVLGRDEVHVWRSRTGEHAARLPALRLLLSRDESERAARFRARRDGDEYTITRALLRLLIGGYEGIPARAVRLDYTGEGKPVLAARDGASPLQFNVSHSGGLALFAFARARRVGVDVEALNRRVDHDDIAQRFFTPAESSALCALPPVRRSSAFFDCWVRKEAALKAWGTGFSLALDRFEVLNAGARMRALECPNELPDLPRRWTIRSLRPGAGYRAALVVEGGGCAVRRLRCEGGLPMAGP